MGVHVADPNVKAIIDIGGQDVKGIAIDADGTVLNFAMNDKCAAGTGRFFEARQRHLRWIFQNFPSVFKGKECDPDHGTVYRICGVRGHLLSRRGQADG